MRGCTSASATRNGLEATYTAGTVTNYAVSNRLVLIEELLGIIPIDRKKDNYVGIMSFSQYLYVKDKKRRIGWGLFARFGFNPGDRNAIDQFYSFSVGGRGLLIPGRDLDFWGLGWAGSHISADLRRDLEELGLGKNLAPMEHVIEAFYNVAVTGWAHLTLDLQFIVDPLIAQVRNTSSSVGNDSLTVVLGSRLQIDF